MSNASNAPTTAVRAPDAPKHGASLRVSSSSFADGATIPMDYVFTGCGGKNKAPQLSWSNAPAGTKSFAITCFDPDAPTGTGYWHWLAFDIPANVTSFDEGDGNGDKPRGGKSGTSDYSTIAYGGPCPPKGDGAHRYIFTVYALDVDKLGPSEKVTGASLVFNMRGHLLATGSIMGKFGH